MDETKKQPPHVLIVDADPSRQKAIAEEIAKSGHQVTFVRDAVEALRYLQSHLEPQATDELAQRLEAVGRLVSGMAHEINNPLTAVIGYTQILMDTDGQDLQKNLKIIKEQAQRCGRIIQDLMVFARRRKPRIDKVDIPAVIQLSLESVTEELRENQIQLKIVCPEEKIEALGSLHSIQRVFVQLLQNAIHALQEKKTYRRIEIKVRSQKEWIEILIQDNGPGISSENLRRIFDPFFSTKDVGKGAGLGLSLCYGLLTEMGGTIRAESKVGEGATFIVRLPSAATENAAHSLGSQTSDLSGKKAQILLVEDEPIILEFMKKVLTDQGYDVMTASDGQSANQLLHQKSFDLVLCDYRLPIKNGYEILKELKSKEIGIEKKFIFVTASLGLAERIEESKIKEAGVGIINKPFTAKDLLLAVQEHLRSSSSPRS